MVSYLPSHMDQGLIFGLLGLWHGFNTLALYLRNPTRFRYRTWFPTNLPWTFKYLELWILLFIIVIFIFIQMSHALPDLSAGIIQAPHVQRFQHVSFAFFLLLYAVVALVSEQSSILPLPPGALHSTFALGFILELMVFHFGHHPGDTLEHFVHMLMQVILLGLVCFMFLEILWPHNFLVSFGRCMLLGFKGAWFFNIGVLINVPSGMPLGCASGAHDFPSCPAGEPLMRAKAMQVLVFAWQMLAIVTVSFVAFATLNTYLMKGPYSPILKDLDDPARKSDGQGDVVELEEDENVKNIRVIEVAFQADCHLQQLNVPPKLDLDLVSQNLSLLKLGSFPKT